MCYSTSFVQAITRYKLRKTMANTAPLITCFMAVCFCYCKETHTTNRIKGCQSSIDNCSGWDVPNTGFNETAISAIKKTVIKELVKPIFFQWASDGQMDPVGNPPCIDSHNLLGDLILCRLKPQLCPWSYEAHLQITQWRSWCHLMFLGSFRWSLKLLRAGETRLALFNGVDQTPDRFSYSQRRLTTYNVPSRKNSHDVVLRNNNGPLAPKSWTGPGIFWMALVIFIKPPLISVVDTWSYAYSRIDRRFNPFLGYKLLPVPWSFS